MGTQVRTAAVVAALGWVFSSSAGCGGGDTGLLINLGGVPARTQTIALKTTLDGRAPTTIDTQELQSSGLSRFGLLLPSGISGQLSVELSALDSDRCTQAAAKTSVALPADRGKELAADFIAQSPRRCEPLLPCAASTLCNRNTKPQGNSLEAVWANSPTDIWAVGLLGAVVHWDGVDWKSVNAGTSLNLWDVWGSGPNDVWVVGQASTTAFAVILHYDGQAWSVSPNTASNDLNGVWGLGANDIYAVGNPQSSGGPGEFWHWDGLKWSRMANTVPGLLYRVWASSPTDIWAAGFNGTLIRHNGTTSTAVNLTGVGVTSTTNLEYVWGTGPSNVFIAGANGIAAHFDGTTWARMAQQGSATNSTLYAAMGSTEGKTVYVLGNNGWLFTSEAPYTTMVPMVNPPTVTSDLRELAIAPNGILWAVGVSGYLGYVDTRP